MAPTLPGVRLGILVNTALAVPVGAVGWFVHGGSGVASGIVGLVLVVTFFVAGKVALVAVGRRSTGMLLPMALGVYAIQVIALGAVLVAASSGSAIDPPVFGWSVFAGALAWSCAEVVSAFRLRIPFYDPKSFRADNPCPDDDPGKRP